MGEPTDESQPKEASPFAGREIDFTGQGLNLTQRLQRMEVLVVGIHLNLYGEEETFKSWFEMTDALMTEADGGASGLVLP